MFQALRRSTKWIVLVVVVTFVGTLFYVGGVNLFGGGSAVATAVVAEVNGEPLQAAQLNSQLAYRIDLLQAQGARVSGLTREATRYDALQDLVLYQLLQQAAETMKVSVDQAEVAQQLDAIRAQFPDSETYRNALRQMGINESYLRGQVEESLRLRNLQEQVTAGVQVTDDEVAQVYEAVHLKQLLVEADPEDAQAWAAARVKAQALRDRLAAGAAFDEVAEGDEGVTQSDLGFVQRSSTLPAAIVEAGFSLEEGGVSEPIETANGYRIVQVVERRRAEGEAFEEEREALREQLLAQKQQEAYQAWLQERRDEARVVIHDPTLRALDLFAEGKLEEAEAAFREAIASDPQNAYLHGLLAQVLSRRGDLEGAIVEARQAVAAFDGDPDLHMLLGNLLREAERPDEAVAEYQKASELSPYDMTLHLNLYGTFLQMGREEEAEAERARLQEIQQLLQQRQQLQEELMGQGEEPSEAGQAPEDGAADEASGSEPEAEGR